MNFLIQKSPEYLIVRGAKIPIKTDFKSWVMFIVANENKDIEMLERALIDIFGGIPDMGLYEDVNNAMIEWLKSGDSKKNAKKQKSLDAGKRAYDFDLDGSIIYCELWKHFPELMKRGISYHEGIELINFLVADDTTILWHNAFARCGDFSKMDKEQQKYWRRERARLKLPDKRTQSQKEADFNDAFAAAFM